MMNSLLKKLHAGFIVRRNKHPRQERNREMGNNEGGGNENVEYGMNQNKKTDTAGKGVKG